jgi:hypothetical protein
MTGLSDADLQNIVKRSYQYVAMNNVNNEFAKNAGRLEQVRG